MAVAGRKPSDTGQTRDRNPRAHDWTDVVDVPYAGPSPELPAHHWMPQTLEWYETVRALPHAILWNPGDWLFIHSTAHVVDGFYREPAFDSESGRKISDGGPKDYAVELRQREKIIGLTVDARRDLRIRYTDPPSSSAAVAAASSPTRDPRQRVAKPAGETPAPKKRTARKKTPPKKPAAKRAVAKKASPASRVRRGA
jgi:hypothetical protein